jgi:uncharacterized LabA/DUF88 family protein
MKKIENNIAYIDGANLYRGILELGWVLDYVKFRKWLEEKYSVKKAYLFIGMVPERKRLYRYLQESGFTLIFKETLPHKDGSIKGNCDAEMVLQVLSDCYEEKYQKAVLVTGDGDFACLVNFLLEKEKLRIVIAPNFKKSSYLIRKIQAPTVFLNQLEFKLKEKAPATDGTEAGSLT